MAMDWQAAAAVAAVVSAVGGIVAGGWHYWGWRRTWFSNTEARLSRLERVVADQKRLINEYRDGYYATTTQHAVLLSNLMKNAETPDANKG